MAGTNEMFKYPAVQLKKISWFLPLLGVNKFIVFAEERILDKTGIGMKKGEQICGEHVQKTGTAVSEQGDLYCRTPGYINFVNTTDLLALAYMKGFT